MKVRGIVTRSLSAESFSAHVPPGMIDVDDVDDGSAEAVTASPAAPKMGGGEMSGQRTGDAGWASNEEVGRHPPMDATGSGGTVGRRTVDADAESVANGEGGGPLTVEVAHLDVFCKYTAPTFS